MTDEFEANAAAAAHARAVLAPLTVATAASPGVDHAAARAAAIAALVATLPTASRAFHDVVAAELLRALEQAEPHAGAHAPWAEVAPLVADALVDRCTWESAWRLLERSDAGATVAAVVLSRLPAPVGPLGAGRLRALASSSNAAHRAAAIAAIVHDPRAVLADPAATASLAEVDHADVRAAVMATLERADVRAFGALQIALLLDATHADVRAAGLRLLERARAATPCPVDGADLLARCAHHGCADVRRALLPLAVERRDGAALAALARAAIFDGDGDDDDVAATLDALAASSADARGGSDDVDLVALVDVFAAAAWRGPGVVREHARRGVEAARGGGRPIVVDAVLRGSPPGAG